MNTKPTVMLLRSSWQSVNIGDIAHTPGLLRTLERFYPEVEVILWPCNIDHGAGKMLKRYFPELQIIEGGIDENGYPQSQEVLDAWKRADFFLHGSGPGLVAYREAFAWHRTTGKSYGYFGVTAERPRPEQIEAINLAQFLLTRDTISIEHVKEVGVDGPLLQFCPDATFACDLRDDESAQAFLEETELKPGGFCCMIPRLRYTPYHKIHNLAMTEEFARRDAVNEKYAEQDHAKMREAIIRIVRETDKEVLLCPEMTYQLDVMDELLFDPLPEDVKPRVKVRRRYWLPDEAAAVYAHASSVVSFECHSPILALRQGVPVMYLRQPTDSIKGQMWRDIGLSRYILEIDDVTAEELAEVAVGQILDPESTRQAMRSALSFVDVTLETSVGILRNASESSPSLRL